MLKISSKGFFKKSIIMESQKKKLVMGFFGFLLTIIFFASNVEAWTGEIHGRVVCDVCGDSSIGPEDHVLEGHYLSLFYLVNFVFLAVFFAVWLCFSALC